MQDNATLIDYIQQEMKVQIDDKIDPSKPRVRPVPRPGYAFRDNDRIQFQSRDFATMLWNKCGLRDRWTELWQHPKTGLDALYGDSVAITDRGMSGRHQPKARIRRAVGLSRNIRMYRYQNGQSFGAHYDESVTDMNDDEEGDGQETVSEYTVLIYLNGDKDSDLIGGETVFYPKGKKTTTSAVTGTGTGRQAMKKGAKGSKSSSAGVSEQADKDSNSASSMFYTLPNGGVAVKPQQGLLLVHKHGDECMLHEGLIVERGYKYVLRTDVVYEP
ncbi:hypothetical protein BGZ99_001165 [Dissophora globulifera]|uniref:Fe2OG dioxygenase domain-containing protein n=1 Tax=Dissophora globulifera TaxID=979702 RepID=A0A9P6QZ12_9FUNG|nr:hypothetical protein BGZ99_001165 [Dissophora globulifera]